MPVVLCCGGRLGDGYIFAGDIDHYPLSARVALCSAPTEIGAYGVSAKGFLAELAAIPDATPLALRLNSPGGSVFDAVAIYNAIKRHSGMVTVWKLNFEPSDRPT